MKKSIFTPTFLLFIAVTTGYAQNPSDIVGFSLPNVTTAIKTYQDSMAWYNIIPEGKAISWRDRFDKEGSSPSTVINMTKWLGKRNRFLNVIFTAGKQMDNISAIAQMRSGGVNLVAAAYINEPFYKAGGYNWNWSLYQVDLLTFCNAVKLNFPDLRVLIPIGPRPSEAGVNGGQRNQDDWNNAAFAFITAHPEFKLGVDIHLYYSGKEVPAMGSATDNPDDASKGTFPAKRAYDYRTDLTDEQYFMDIYYQADPMEYYEKMILYIQTKTDAPIFVTEYTYTATSNFHGNLAYGMSVWKLMNLYGNDDRLYSLDVNAGFGGSQTSAYCPRKSYDVRDVANLNNVGSVAWDETGMYLMQEGILSSYELDMILPEPGTYSLWYVNTGMETGVLFNIPTDCQVSYLSITGITGQHFSSIGRNTAWTDKGSVLSANAVTGITVQEGMESVLNPLSFGFIKVVVEKVPNTAPVANAGGDVTITLPANSVVLTGFWTDLENNVVKTEWFYGSNLISSGNTVVQGNLVAGTYTYNFRVTDSEGLSSSDGVTVTVLPAPVQVCYKKRWLFRGCKIDKDCRYNNCIN